MSATLTTGTRSSAQTYASRPSRGTVGIACLILTESALFIIIVVAYVFYLGKSLSGPTPHDVLDLPILASICLFSSSVTVHLGVSALGKNEPRRATLWIGLTALLGLIFLGFTSTMASPSALTSSAPPSTRSSASTPLTLSSASACSVWSRSSVSRAASTSTITTGLKSSPTTGTSSTPSGPSCLPSSTSLAADA